MTVPLEQAIAATPYASSTVHALLEIGRTPGITAAELARVLLLDRSSVSRLLRKLIDAGEVRDDGPAASRRQNALSLTETGRRTVAGVDEYGIAQVSEAFGLRCRAAGLISTTSCARATVVEQMFRRTHAAGG